MKKRGRRKTSATPAELKSTPAIDKIFKGEAFRESK